MPPSKLPEFIKRLEALEHSVEKHLIEGGAVKADIRWLKWLTMGIALKLLSDLFMK